MKIASHNVNGIRAAHKRGWRDWVDSVDLDVICLQEVRATETQLPDGVFDGYHVSWDPGNIKGRNGVAVLSHTEPTEVRTGIGLAEFADEGRYIEIDLPAGDTTVTVASLYLPKGATADDDRDKYDRKFRFLAGLHDLLIARADQATRAGTHYVITGDFNIARAELDVKNWKGNLKNEGFLPEERAWFADMLDATGLVDAVRTHVGDEPGPYSWWSWRGQAFNNDAGWRIDYHLATPGLANTVNDAGVYREPSRDERLSDHSPVIVNYDV